MLFYFSFAINRNLWAKGGSVASQTAQYIHTWYNILLYNIYNIQVYVYSTRRNWQVRTPGYLVNIGLKWKMGSALSPREDEIGNKNFSVAPVVFYRGFRRHFSISNISWSREIFWRSINFCRDFIATISWSQNAIYNTGGGPSLCRKICVAAFMYGCQQENACSKQGWDL